MRKSLHIAAMLLEACGFGLVLAVAYFGIVFVR